jgi:hypothetical protein
MEGIKSSKSQHSNHQQYDNAAAEHADPYTVFFQHGHPALPIVTPQWRPRYCATTSLLCDYEFGVKWMRLRRKVR